MTSNHQHPAGPIPGQVWSVTASSPEELEASVKPVDAHVLQLQAGRFLSSAEGAFLDDVLVAAAHHNVGVRGSGTLIHDALHVHNVRSAHPVTHGTLPLMMNSMTVTMPGCDMDLAGRGPSSALHIAIRLTRWIDVAQVLCADSGAVISPAPAAVECDPAAIDALWRRVGWILRAAEAYSACFQWRDIRRVAELGTVWSVMALLERSRRRVEDLASAAARRAAMAKVDAYLRDNLSAPLTLVDLCRVGGLKARALQYAFLETHGISPMRYLKLVRLDQARRRLIRNAGNRSVSAVALECGFWHMAQFAQDYRTIYGELPSQTSRRANTE